MVHFFDPVLAKRLAPLLKRAADLLAGGLADHVPDSAVSARQLQLGQQHEKEHTRNPALARELAKDHLVEDPRYYTQLNRFEARLKKQDQAGRHMPSEFLSRK